jgi:Plant transposon protein
MDDDYEEYIKKRKKKKLEEEALQQEMMQQYQVYGLFSLAVMETAKTMMTVVQEEFVGGGIPDKVVRWFGLLFEFLECSFVLTIAAGLSVSFLGPFLLSWDLFRPMSPLSTSLTRSSTSFSFCLMESIPATYSRFVKAIRQPVAKKDKRFTEWQEAARKDIERAFGVLQARWQCIARPIYLVGQKLHAEGHPDVLNMITDSKRWRELDNREEHTRLLNALIEHKKGDKRMPGSFD